MINKKIIFFGTPDFAVPALTALHQEGYNLSLVITQADQPVGRKQALTPPPVKLAAQKLGLPICQKLSGVKNFKADLGVVVAYGKIIPQNILAIFSCGVLNIHPSLLPKYRGPSPIQAAILNGDLKTGVSIIKLDSQMDHGNIIIKAKYSISNKDTYLSLSEKLAKAGADLLIQTLPDYISGNIQPKPQDDSQATVTALITKADGQINWLKSASEIERQIRAFYSWPSAYADFQVKNHNLKIKLLSADVSEQTDGPVGQLQNKNGRLIVVCAQNSLIINKLQPAGKKAMVATEFINGYLK